MSSVLGHTVEWDFTEMYRKWNSCAPAALFDAPTEQMIKVHLPLPLLLSICSV